MKNWCYTNHDYMFDLYELKIQVYEAYVLLFRQCWLKIMKDVLFKSSQMAMNESQVCEIDRHSSLVLIALTPGIKFIYYNSPSNRFKISIL